MTLYVWRLLSLEHFKNVLLRSGLLSLFTFNLNIGYLFQSNLQSDSCRLSVSVLEIVDSATNICEVFDTISRQQFSENMFSSPCNTSGDG